MTSNPFPLRASALALGALLALAGCQRVASEAPPPAQAIARDTVCSLDGMTVADFPGPKAQILYDQGAPDFFCDTMELFSVLQHPEQKRAIRAVYVQDMAGADWNHPRGHWIDAHQAWYVVGSRARGSMGGTFASFAAQAAAQAFAGREGGRVLRFDQITPDMAQLDGGVLDDHKM